MQCCLVNNRCFGNQHIHVHWRTHNEASLLSECFQAHCKQPQWITMHSCTLCFSYSLSACVTLPGIESGNEDDFFFCPLYMHSAFKPPIRQNKNIHPHFCAESFSDVICTHTVLTIDCTRAPNVHKPYMNQSKLWKTQTAIYVGVPYMVKQTAVPAPHGRPELLYP